jgi:hypothetical protein
MFNKIKKSRHVGVFYAQPMPAENMLKELV